MTWYKVTQENSNLILDFRTGHRPRRDLDQAAEHTVESILQRCPPPYNIMASGGIDSQTVLNSWVKYGRNFAVYVGRYLIDGQIYNQHDIGTIETLAGQLGIEPNYIDLNVLDFYFGDYEEYVYNYRCSSPQINVMLKLLDLNKHRSGTAIVSGNCLEPTAAIITPPIFSLCRYAEIVNHSVIPYFFLETPEIAYSYINFLESNNLTRNGYDERYQFYQTLGQPLIKQQTKLNGFELIKDYFDQHYQHLITPKLRLLPDRHNSKRVFDMVFRNPYIHKLRDPGMTYQMDR
jgi:hypothetical protein